MGYSGVRLLQDNCLWKPPGAKSLGMHQDASYAGYLVLIPLGAVAFMSVGRHPLAGLAAAFAAVGGTFGVNILITPIDGIMTEVTNESAALVDPSRTISLTSNILFGI